MRVLPRPACREAATSAGRPQLRRESWCPMQPAGVPTAAAAGPHGRSGTAAAAAAASSGIGPKRREPYRQLVATRRHLPERSLAGAPPSASQSPRAAPPALLLRQMRQARSARSAGQRQPRRASSYPMKGAGSSTARAAARRGLVRAATAALQASIGSERSEAETKRRVLAPVPRRHALMLHRRAAPARRSAAVVSGTSKASTAANRRCQRTPLLNRARACPRRSSQQLQTACQATCRQAWQRTHSRNAIEP